MPVTSSAKKKQRSDARKQKINQKVKKQLKSALKKFDLKPSETALGEAYSMLDTAAKKDVIHKKRAARKKSRLAKLLSKNLAGKRQTKQRQSSKGK